MPKKFAIVIERHRCMQIVCQCLTRVFSFSVGDDSGLMTSLHSCAGPPGWEQMSLLSLQGSAIL